MEAKRWTLGVVLAAAVSLWGLVEADASPFSTQILADDLANTVNGSAAEAGDENGNGNGDGASSTGEDSSGGTENDGHGNNEDGVDSSNQGNSKTGEDTVCADGTICDDEIKTTGNTKK
jgi:hypothetical protein